MLRQNKYLILFFPILLSQTLIAQDYTEALFSFYFGRLPSARAEALGTGMVASDAGPFASFHNPAAVCLNRGLTLGASHASPLYLLRDAGYMFFGATYELGPFGHAGLSMYRLNLDEESNITGPGGPDELFETFEPSTTRFSITFAKETLKNLYAGVNVSQVRDKPHDDTFSAIQIDLGLLKTIELDTNQRLSLGANLFDLTHSKIFYLDETQKDALPVILNIGGSWQMSTGRSALNTFDLHTLSFLVQVEYQHLLNSDYYDGLKGGAELGIIERIYPRCGLYRQDRNDYGFPEINKDVLEDFTYGIGIAQ
jgi:hypothetical protein